MKCERVLKVIKHILIIEVKCPKTGVHNIVKIESLLIQRRQYFSDWEEKVLDKEIDFIELECLSCGENHQYEIC